LKIAINSRIFLEKGTGVPNYVAQLYRACLKLDRANEYVFFQPNRSRTIGETQVVAAPEGLAGAAWFDSVRVNKLICKNRPNIFHGPSHILPLSKQRGVKYVVTIHDLSFLVLPHQYDWKHRLYYGWRVASSVKMADMVVADSHNTKRDIIHYYQIPPERIQVVHLGVAEKFLRTTAARKERVVADKYFLSITTHPKRKNILGAIKAFAQFAVGHDVKYVIAGLMAETHRQELLGLAEQLGIKDRVLLFGYADDEQLVRLYQNAEFTLYPSFYEGFGLPVVEAMACGCPVITSNTSSLPEIMPDAEGLVNPYDLDDMAAKMQRMLELSPEEHRRISEKNQRHSRNFTWEKTAGQMIEIFEALNRESTKKTE
jgi:glycosyltransferase involved in cell wall biosynthesis